MVNTVTFVCGVASIFAGVGFKEEAVAIVEVVVRSIWERCLCRACIGVGLLLHVNGMVEVVRKLHGPVNGQILVKINLTGDASFEHIGEVEYPVMKFLSFIPCALTSLYLAVEHIESLLAIDGVVFVLVEPVKLLSTPIFHFRLWTACCRCREGEVLTLGVLLAFALEIEGSSFDSQCLE